MIIHSKAIILRSVDYQESSKIVTVLTPTHGKLALIARGAKKPKSKLSGLIDPGNVLDVVFYYKSSRSVQSLTEASVLLSVAEFRRHLEKMAVLYAVLELIAQVVHEHEVNEAVYTFLENIIGWLSTQNPVNPSIFSYIQVRCADLCGFGIDAHDCKAEHPAYFNIASGSISNEIETELSYKLTVTQAQFLCTASASQSSEVLRESLAGQELKQLIHHLDVYFKYHIEGYKDRRSDSIFEHMLLNSPA